MSAAAGPTLDGARRQRTEADGFTAYNPDRTHTQRGRTAFIRGLVPREPLAHAAPQLKQHGE